MCGPHCRLWCSSVGSSRRMYQLSNLTFLSPGCTCRNRDRGQGVSKIVPPLFLCYLSVSPCLCLSVCLPVCLSVCLFPLVYFMQPLKLVCIYLFMYCHNSRYMCDCSLIWFACSSEHLAKVQFVIISLTFVKATSQSNKLLCLASSLRIPLSLSLTH